MSVDAALVGFVRKPLFCSVAFEGNVETVVWCVGLCVNIN